MEQLHLICQKCVSVSVSHEFIERRVVKHLYCAVCTIEMIHNSALYKFMIDIETVLLLPPLIVVSSVLHHVEI